MAERMKCAECNEVFDADDLVYNDEIGSDVCEECDDNANAVVSYDDDDNEGQA